MQSEQINELASALVKAQSAMRAATYNKVNPHFKNKYADLAAVIDAVRKPLSDNGLSISQTTELAPESLLLRTTLYHTSGQWIAAEYPLPSAANPQQLGSALTYARRYSLSCITCIAADDDDDANTADKSPPQTDFPAGEKISHAQISEISAFADSIGANLGKLCEHLDVVQIADLPASKYAMAMEALENYEVRKKERGKIESGPRK